MAGIVRKFFSQFGSALTPASNVAQFGSLAAGAPAYTIDPEAIIQLAAWANGFNGAVIGNRSPAKQDMNGLIYAISYHVAYLLTRGLAEWNLKTTYNTGDVCRSANQWYTSRTDGNINNAVTDTNNWQNAIEAMTGQNLCRAWVSFDGINNNPDGTSVIRSSQNVTSVTHVAAGRYLVNFAAPMPSNNYVSFGMPSTENTAMGGPGDNNHLCGGTTGIPGIRNVNQCQIINWEPSLNISEDAGNISVGFFG